MARSCGIRIGPRRYELVVVDGSPKKHKISAYSSGDLPYDEDDPIGSTAAVLRDVLKEHNVAKDNIGLVIDTGLAAFRNLKLPFDDASKIEQIIKFEVESQLPQWNIDDVIIDYHIMESGNESSDLLVTAVPKAELAYVLDICQRSGFEPLEAELETTAMVNAAYTADICQVDDAQVLVHIGDESTSVVVMDGGKVREMRAIHIGAATHEIQRPNSDEGEDEGEPSDPFGENEEESTPEVDPIEAQRRLEQAIKRIRRELGRTVSAARTVNPIDSIYVCGRELPGLVGSTILDVPVYVLDVFEEDSGQPLDGFGELVVAYGAAIRQMGGGLMTPSLRREELKYTGAFERIELPLAVACLLLMTLLCVHGIFTYKKLRSADELMHYWTISSNNYLMGNPAKGQPGNLEYPPDDIAAYVKKVDVELDDPDYPGDTRPRYDQMRFIQSLLKNAILDKEKELGRDTEITKPQSALHALTLVLRQLDESKKSGARPSLRGMTATFQPGKSSRPDSVVVKLDVTFFAESSFQATQHYEDFKAKITQQPWGEEPQARTTDSLEDGNGVYISGLSVRVNLASLPSEDMQ